MTDSKLPADVLASAKHIGAEIREMGGINPNAARPSDIAIDRVKPGLDGELQHDPSGAIALGPSGPRDNTKENGLAPTGNGTARAATPQTPKLDINAIKAPPSTPSQSVAGAARNDPRGPGFS